MFFLLQSEVRVELSTNASPPHTTWGKTPVQTQGPTIHINLAALGSTQSNRGIGGILWSLDQVELLPPSLQTSQSHHTHTKGTKCWGDSAGAVQLCFISHRDQGPFFVHSSVPGYHLEHLWRTWMRGGFGGRDLSSDRPFPTLVYVHLCPPEMLPRPAELLQHFQSPFVHRPAPAVPPVPRHPTRPSHRQSRPSRDFSHPSTLHNQGPSDRTDIITETGGNASQQTLSLSLNRPVEFAFPWTGGVSRVFESHCRMWGDKQGLVIQPNATRWCHTARVSIQR